MDAQTRLGYLVARSHAEAMAEATTPEEKQACENALLTAFESITKITDILQSKTNSPMLLSTRLSVDGESRFLQARLQTVRAEADSTVLMIRVGFVDDNGEFVNNREYSQFDSFAIECLYQAAKTYRYLLSRGTIEMEKSTRWSLDGLKKSIEERLTQAA